MDLWMLVGLSLILFLLRNYSHIIDVPGVIRAHILLFCAGSDVLTLTGRSYEDRYLLVTVHTQADFISGATLENRASNTMPQYTTISYIYHTYDNIYIYYHI